MGEVEPDALYVAVDKAGTLYVLPIEAKSQAESEMIVRIQVSQVTTLPVCHTTVLLASIVMAL